MPNYSQKIAQLKKLGSGKILISHWKIGAGEGNLVSHITCFVKAAIYEKIYFVTPKVTPSSLDG